MRMLRCTLPALPRPAASPKACPRKARPPLPATHSNSRRNNNSQRRRSKGESNRSHNSSSSNSSNSSGGGDGLCELGAYLWQQVDE